MSATTETRPAIERFASVALPAVRSIGWREIRASMLLGLGVTGFYYLVSIVPIAEIARTMPLGLNLAGSVIGNQLRAFCLMVAIVIADRAVDEGARRRRAYVFAAVFGSLAGFAASEPVMWAWRTYVLPNRWPEDWEWLHGTAALFYWPIFSLTQWLPVGGAIVFLHADRRAARQTARLLRAAELDRIGRSRIALESRLQAMQARVEPQFLFNTLAQVEQLFEVDRPLAARMLDDLIAYLRAAMPAMRDTSSTVAQEVELARAYLDIVRLRLGDRLQVAIDVPPEAGGARIPPMMLLPLTDHAVTHGIEPRRGGMLQIAIEARAPRLVLRIVDSGAGFVPEAAGDGIADIRARLAALYGPEAALALHRRGSGATEAVLDLPLESRGGAGGALPNPG